MEQDKFIRELFGKYLKGECTEREIRLLFVHFDLQEDEAMLRQLIQSAVNDERRIDPLLHDKMDALTQRVEAKLTHAIRQRKRSFGSRLFSRPSLVAAATALLLISIGTLLYKQQAETKKTPEIVVADVGDVSPGGNLATLTLADGSIIQLSTEQHGIVVGQDITYSDGSVILGWDDLDVEHLQLTTPKGGTYQLTLSDGTKVWLNAASTLRYPSRFTSKERVVELEGEAFFDVSRQEVMGTPFRVVTKGQTVDVLGTQFNVEAYTGVDQVLTTLVEGVVQIQPIHNKQSTGRESQHVVLNPGEQSVVKGGQTSVNAVDVNTFTAWKSGLFSFKDTEMRNAMNQLARWYDVDIVYEGHIPETYFFGDIRRDRSLGQALAVLKKSGVNFRIGKKDDRNILIVLP